MMAVNVDRQLHCYERRQSQRVLNSVLYVFRASASQALFKCEKCGYIVARLKEFLKWSCPACENRREERSSA